MVYHPLDETDDEWLLVITNVDGVPEKRTYTVSLVGHPCLPESGECLPLCLDFDGDGEEVCGGDQGDCDDQNPDVHTGADEVCDEIDNNCDAELADCAMEKPMTIQRDVSFRLE